MKHGRERGRAERRGLGRLSPTERDQLAFDLEEKRRSQERIDEMLAYESSLSKTPRKAKKPKKTR